MYFLLVFLNFICSYFFLWCNIQNGMDMGIVNVGCLFVYDDIELKFLEMCENLFWNKDFDGIEKLFVYVQVMYMYIYCDNLFIKEVKINENKVMYFVVSDI